MAPRCRGYRSRRLQAFQDDPKLLIIRPAPPAAGLNDLKPLNLSTVLMVVHKDCYTSLNLTNKAAAAGGIRPTAGRPKSWAMDFMRINSLTDGRSGF